MVLHVAGSKGEGSGQLLLQSALSGRSVPILLSKTIPLDLITTRSRSYLFPRPKGFGTDAKNTKFAGYANAGVTLGTGIDDLIGVGVTFSLGSDSKAIRNAIDVICKSVLIHYSTLNAIFEDFA